MLFFGDNCVDDFKSKDTNGKYEKHECCCTRGGIRAAERVVGRINNYFHYARDQSSCFSAFRAIAIIVIVSIAHLGVNEEKIVFLFINTNCL